MRFSEEAWSELRISTQTTIIDRLLAVPRPAFRRLAPNLFGTRNAGLRIGTRLFDHEALQELRTDILTADQEVTTRATVPEPQQATADGFFFPELALPRSRVILVLAVAALAWGIQQIPAINEAIGHWK